MGHRSWFILWGQGFNLAWYPHLCHLLQALCKVMLQPLKLLLGFLHDKTGPQGYGGLKLGFKQALCMWQGPYKYQPNFAQTSIPTQENLLTQV